MAPGIGHFQSILLYMVRADNRGSLYICIKTNLDTRGLTQSFGIFQTYYETELLRSYSASEISWIGSVQAFLLPFLGSCSGPLYDLGYAKALNILGSFLIVFGMVMTSLGSQYYEILLSQGITVGIGTSLLLVPSISLVAQYFSRKRILAIGISTTGSGIGKPSNLLTDDLV